MDNLKEKVIFDCDNTMGLEGRDVDDGLAFLYLLGREELEIKGITTTYGNSSTLDVYNNTKNMFKELKIKKIPLIKGAESGGNSTSAAAEFLIKMAAETPGEITLLATGALTNLYSAYELDNNFFNNLKGIVLMGGITEPLLVNGVNLDELNFSCDPLAALKVLNAGCKVSVLTGQICLQAFFGEKELTKLKAKKENRIYSYITKNIEPWYAYAEKTFGVFGFYNWDIVAAVYITNPELFEDSYEYIATSEADLRKGYINICSEEDSITKINIPSKIKDRERFKQIIFEAWNRIL